MRVPTTNDRQRAIAQNRAAGLDTGLNVTGYMIGGLVAYGLIGWLIGHLIHASWPVPAGMLLGLMISTGYVIYRYGTATGVARSNPSGDDPRSPRREKENR
jgi:F0F1-type ATP synthase assembly protein I